MGPGRCLPLWPEPSLPAQYMEGLDGWWRAGGWGVREGRAALTCWCCQVSQSRPPPLSDASRRLLGWAGGCQAGEEEEGILGSVTTETESRHTPCFARRGTAEYSVRQSSDVRQRRGEEAVVAGCGGGGGAPVVITTISLSREKEEDEEKPRRCNFLRPPEVPPLLSPPIGRREGGWENAAALSALRLTQGTAADVTGKSGDAEWAESGCGWDLLPIQCVLLATGDAEGRGLFIGGCGTVVSCRPTVCCLRLCSHSAFSRFCAVLLSFSTQCGFCKYSYYKLNKFYKHVSPVKV